LGCVPIAAFRRLSRRTCIRVVSGGALFTTRFSLPPAALMGVAPTLQTPFEL
jgi:hypothetical protein